MGIDSGVETLKIIDKNYGIDSFSRISSREKLCDLIGDQKTILVDFNYYLIKTYMSLVCGINRNNKAVKSIQDKYASIDTFDIPEEKSDEEDLESIVADSKESKDRLIMIALQNISNFFFKKHGLDKDQVMFSIDGKSGIEKDETHRKRDQAAKRREAANQTAILKIDENVKITSRAFFDDNDIWYYQNVATDENGSGESDFFIVAECMMEKFDYAMTSDQDYCFYPIKVIMPELGKRDDRGHTIFDGRKFWSYLYPEIEYLYITDLYHDIHKNEPLFWPMLHGFVLGNDYSPLQEVGGKMAGQGTKRVSNVLTTNRYYYLNEVFGTSDYPGIRKWWSLITNRVRHYMGDADHPLVIKHEKPISSKLIEVGVDEFTITKGVRTKEFYFLPAVGKYDNIELKKGFPISSDRYPWQNNDLTFTQRLKSINEYNEKTPLDPKVYRKMIQPFIDHIENSNKDRLIFYVRAEDGPTINKSIKELREFILNVGKKTTR